jgi:hypothetical protein
MSPKIAIDTISTDKSRLIFAIVIAIGFACPIAQYFARSSYWHDEALLVLNVMGKTIAQLPFKLDYNQAAPPMFLIAQRGIFLLLGASEFSLRLLPLVFELAAFVIFALLCWRIFPVPVAACVALFFALSDKLIWHATQVKPYSGDVFCSTLLLYLAIAYRPATDDSADSNDQLSPTQRLVILSIVSVVLVWFSYPVAIVYGGLSLMLLPEIFRRGVRDRVIYIIANAAVVISFVLLHHLCIAPQRSEYLATFWAPDFPPYDHIARIPLWLLSELYALCDHPYRSFGAIFALLIIAGIAGLITTRQTRLLTACLLPFLLALVASFLKQYPFNGDRTTVYLLPNLFLLSGAGMIYLRTRATNAPAVFRIAWLILGGIVVARGLGEGAYRFVHPRSRSGIRPVVAYLREHRQPDEAIYLLTPEIDPNTGGFTSAAGVDPLCYWPDPPQPVHRGLPADLHQIPEKRFWVIFSCRPPAATNDVIPLKAQLRTIGVPVIEYFPKDKGGCAMLYERNDSAP